MTTLQKVKIKDHCEITSSKRIFAHEYLGCGVPFYRGKEISEKQRSSDEVNNQIFISRNKFEEIKSKYGAPQKGDILLTSVGTIGNPYLVKEGEEFYFKDGNLTWFRNFKDLNSQWLYYWLLSPQGKSELNKCTIGASQKAYTINLLEGIEIDLLPAYTQTCIASVLSTYDDLIENNEKRIKVLEEMAQLLYTEWFVQFKFPGHEKVKLIDSGTEYGMIPEGWEVVPISKLAEFMNGYPFKPNQLGEEGLPVVKIPELRSGILDKTPRNSGNGINNKYVIYTGDILFSWSATLLVNIWNSGEALLNQHLFKVTPKNINYRAYSFYTLVLLVEKIRKHVVGATMQHLRKDTIESAKVLLPNIELLMVYEKQATKYLDEIGLLYRKNQNLSKTRDLLIPQLITGKRKLK